MALHRIHPRDLAADPFVTTVRRRHPDVDIVLLPPRRPAVGRPSADPSATTADAPVPAAVDAAAAALRGWLPGADTHSAWHPGCAGAVRPSVVVRAVRSDGAELLGRLGAALRGAGWETHARPTALVARAGPLTLIGSHTPSTGLVLVGVTGEDVVVGSDRAAALLREGRPR